MSFHELATASGVSIDLFELSAIQCTIFCITNRSEKQTLKLGEMCYYREIIIIKRL